MRFPLLLLSVVLLQGCTTPDDTTTVAPVVTDPAVATDPVVTEDPAAGMTAQTDYTCESGQTIQASYPTDSTAVVTYEGQTIPMTIDVSGSGARYVGGDFEWWTKGTDEGTLFRHNSDGTSGELVETCS